MDYLPSPRHSAEATFVQHIGGSVSLTSPIDPRVKLYIDPKEFDFHIEFHTASLPHALDAMLETAWLRGYCIDTGADFYEQTVMLDETLMRTYLVPVEPIRDTPLEDNLPDLTQTAYGPHSGFMEAVSV